VDKTRVFALDIGTRKIVGLVLEENETGHRVVDVEILEHTTRAMMDGQIHDVETVAATILKIKNALEERQEITLDSVVVAAAGRALKTSRGSCYKSRQQLGELSTNEVRALEIEAVQEAQYKLAQEEIGNREHSNYFCVGYSVVSYLLEGQVIGNLVGQVANEVGVEIIATFLPRVVVDSLFSSLNRAGLEVKSLTLEPIAALSVAIPPGMRLLNLALVDIGAGTSDIALVKEGNVFAYAMVPLAGDELTEYLASQYLLDFDTAERAKRLLMEQDQIEVSDILGNPLHLSSKELQQELQPLIDEMTGEIARHIIDLNQKVTDAVVCVGGGSLTPSLTVSLAENLGIPARRVGIRTIQNIDYITTDSSFLNTPQGITPLGIAYNYFTTPPVPFIKVTVNGRETPLWNLGAINVAGALLSSGISLSNIYGKPGMGKTIEVNGYVKVIKGSMGTAPLIKVNNQPASLETNLQNGDTIEFAPGQDGEEAHITGRDLVPAIKGQITVNDEEFDLEPVITVNGEPFAPDAEIPDRARIEFKSVNSVFNVLRLSGVDEYWLQKRLYKFYLDEREITVYWLPLEVHVNGVIAEVEQLVEPGDSITYTRKPLRPCLNDLLGDHDFLAINVKVNGEEIRLRGKGASIVIDGEPAGIYDEVHDGARITLNREEGRAILSDIFNVVEIKPAKNAKLFIKVDGESAGFTTPIKEGSQIDLSWE
jgi:cell division protein FtsA